jgi:hypothetical protein
MASGIGKKGGGIAIVFFLPMVYFEYSQYAGARKAAEFCASVAIGSSIMGLLERAIESGTQRSRRPLRWVPETDGSEYLTATFSGATPIDRHICWIVAKEGRVISTHVVYLD